MVRLRMTQADTAGVSRTQGFEEKGGKDGIRHNGTQREGVGHIDENG